MSMRVSTAPCHGVRTGSSPVCGVMPEIVTEILGIIVVVLIGIWIYCKGFNYDD